MRATMSNDDTVMSQSRLIGLLSPRLKNRLAATTF